MITTPIDQSAHRLRRCISDAFSPFFSYFTALRVTGPITSWMKCWSSSWIARRISTCEWDGMWGVRCRRFGA